MAIQQSINGLRELALFAGAGGGILGGKLLGWRTVCAVERDAYAAQVLAQRQNDGILAPFPIWSQIESFDGKPWRGIVDVVSGGFPCQDISVAGKGAGITGDRSGLWSEMARIIGEVRPRFAFIENSPALVNRGLDRVLADLAEMGFDAEWGCLDRTTSAPITAASGVGLWPTPCHGSNKWGGTFQEVGGSQNKLRGTPIGKLYVNPDFWESLMGWPIGWTGIAPLATDKTQEWLQQHSVCSQQERELSEEEYAI